MQVLLGGLCEKLVYYFEVYIFNRKNRKGNTTLRAQKCKCFLAAFAKNLCTTLRFIFLTAKTAKEIQREERKMQVLLGGLCEKLVYYFAVKKASLKKPTKIS
jgi:hypothetical protein